MVDNELIFPMHNIVTDLRVKRTIRLTEGMQLLIAVLCVPTTNEMQKFIDVERRIGHAPLLDPSLPHRCPPCEVAAQLRIRERIIRWKILVDRAVVNIVVLVGRHQPRLLQKEFCPRLPSVACGRDQRTHRTQQLRCRRFWGGRGCVRNRLVAIDHPQ